jgi:hypothetical protein
VPADLHEHVGRAGVFRCHTLDFDGFPLPERGYDFGSDALGLKRESVSSSGGDPLQGFAGIQWISQNMFDRPVRHIAVARHVGLQTSEIRIE